MEKIGVLDNEEMKLMESFRQSLNQKESSSQSELSIYKGEIASKEEIKTEVKKLIAAFPEVTNDFLIILIERLVENGFTKERVKDAIGHTIDTNPYKRPSIADIISFDRKIRLYTYNEVQAKCMPGYLAFEHFERIEIGGKKRFIEK